MRKGVLVSSREQVRYETVGKYLRRELKLAELASILDVSERQAYRIAAAVRKRGLAGVVHGNAGRVPPNKTDELTEQRLKTLIRGEYFDFNMTHLRERLLQDHGIEVKRETLRRICKSIGHTKHARRLRKRARPLRERHSREGFMLQMDGSHHDWISGQKWCLISAIDDATSEIVACEFFSSEDTLSCLRILRKIVESRGCPLFLYVDRAGLYGGMKRQDFSHFDRACVELGIKIIFANSPQGKGRVERSFSTLQDRLVPELRRRRITDMGKANQFLWDEFLPKQWSQFTVKPREAGQAWQQPSTDLDFEKVFSMRYERKVTDGETISFNAVTYVLTHPEGISLAGYTVEIRFDLNGKLSIYYAQSKLGWKVWRKRAG